MKMNDLPTSTRHSLRGTWEDNLPMARHVSWRAGGVARRAYVPADLADLAQCLATLPADEAVMMVGLGSNLLVRDGGFAGTVILLHGALKGLAMDGDRVYAEAGASSPKVAHFCADQQLQGAEFLAGIPGTIGGALAMNAGCYGSETWDVVAQVQTVNRQGQLQRRSAADYDIGYRHVAPRHGQEEWFVAAWLQLAPGDREASKRQIKEWLEKRLATQPLQLPNAGSVFRNPPGDHAARLIQAAGLKGFTVGGAQVSEKHANFIVNAEGKATAADIENLIEHVQQTVQQQFGVELIREVRIVGNKGHSA